MPESLVNLLYIVSAMLFVFGLKRLSRADTARKGNLISAIGMLLAIVTALASDNLIHWPWIVVGLVAGSVIGALAARLVAMTSMPEMVALFNGFGGIASLLVGWVEFQRLYSAGTLASTSWNDLVIIGITILIGGVTFTGSMIAWGKLSEKMTSRPILYGGQQVVNGLAVPGSGCDYSCFRGETPSRAGKSDFLPDTLYRTDCPGRIEPGTWRDGCHTHRRR